MAIIYYIIQHLLFIFLSSRRRQVLLFLSIILLGLLVLYNKPDTYDIISYTQAVHQPGQFEFLFEKLLAFWSYFFSSDRDVIWGVQLSILLIFASAAFDSKKFSIFIFCVIISSLFFTLTINNNLRQGVSAVLILLAFQEKKINLRFYLCIVTAYFFHGSAVLFLPLLLCIMFWVKCLQKYFTLILNYLLIILFGIAAGGVVVELVSITGYGHYVGKNLTIDNERTSLPLKVALVGMTFFISEIFMGFRKINYGVDLFRYSRLFIFAILIVLSLAPYLDEIGARTLFFYFGVELFLMISLGNIFIVRPIVIILISYAFAFNAWNILGFSG